MKINWFPGHMTKALRMMQEEVKNIDVIIYVLDARAPKSCFNHHFILLLKVNLFYLYLTSRICVTKKI